MKKIILVLIICFPISSFSQEKNNNLLKDKDGNLINYIVTNYKSNCNIRLRFDEGTKWISGYNKISSEPLKNNVFLGNAKKITLESIINKDSIKYYRYSIIQDDSVYLVDDAIPNKIKFKWNNRSDFPNHLTVSLGEFNVTNKKIVVQMYKLPSKNKVNTIVIYNIPVLNPIILSKLILSESFSVKNLSPAQVNKIIKQKGLNSLDLVSKTLKDGDTIRNSNKISALDIAIKKTDFDFIYEMKISRYGDNYGEETVLLSKDWRDSRMKIDAEYFKKPGIYRGQISANIYNSLRTSNGASWQIPSTSFTFTVLESEKKVFSKNQLITYGLIWSIVLGLLIGGTTVLIMNRRKIKKVAEQSKQKELAQLQLNSVRSQLNPHFLFNALAGIQNLMNKNEIDNANRYLTKFARLTRNVLESKELISLTEEKTLLDDYLQMEQLRFGFQYKIHASTDLDTENIEIPAMLLQPFAENAVKHGIAEKGKAGNIEITFKSESSNLILLIRDNGKGFDTSKGYDGLGLALSKNRISLLNTIYKDSPFVLSIQSGINGTEITIILKQWL